MRLECQTVAPSSPLMRQEVGKAADDQIAVSAKTTPSWGRINVFFGGPEDRPVSALYA